MAAVEALQRSAGFGNQATQLVGSAAQAFYHGGWSLGEEALIGQLPAGIQTLLLKAFQLLAQALTFHSNIDRTLIDDGNIESGSGAHTGAFGHGIDKLNARNLGQAGDDVLILLDG